MNGRKTHYTCRHGARKKGIVLKDIADVAQVSLITVSRALRGVDGVSEAKRAQILKIARRLNYMPNSSARSLVTMNSDLIGISVPNLFNNVFAEIMASMRGTFDSAGFSSVVDTSEYDVNIEFAWAERLLTWRPAGMILTGTHHHPALRDALRRAGVPTLQIWDVTDDPIDVCVGIDHHAAGQEVAQYCRDLGYARPGFVGTAEGRDTRAEARLSGFAARYAAAGRGEVRIARSGDRNPFVAGQNATRDILNGPAHSRADVIFYLNDHLAFGGLTACQTAGLSVPDEIGIVASTRWI
nr:LacI family DNA-binding transcriptional regulator [uncultured Tateyamaria sp.]